MTSCRSAMLKRLVSLLVLFAVSGCDAQAKRDPNMGRFLEAVASPVYPGTGSIPTLEHSAARSELVKRVTAFSESPLKNPPPNLELFEHNLATCSSLLTQIETIDGNKPSNMNLLTEFAVAAFEAETQKKKSTFQQSYNKRASFFIDTAKRAAAESQKKNLLTTYRDTDDERRKLAAQLEDWVASQSGPESSEPFGLSIAYLPSWHGTYTGETVSLKHDGDKPIEDLTVFVSFHTDTGSFSHMHHIRAITPGQSVRFHYPYYQNDFRHGYAHGHFNKVEFRLYTEEKSRTVETITDDAYYESYYASYASDLTATLTYLDNEPGIFSEWTRGVKLSIGGVSRLPVDAITVTFRNGSSEKGLRWSRTGFLNAGDSTTLRSEQFTFDPSEVDVKFDLRGTSQAITKSYSVR